MRRLILTLALAVAAGPALADDAAVSRLVIDYEAFWLADDPITAGGWATAPRCRACRT